MARSKKQAAGSAHAEPTAKTPFPNGLALPVLRALADAGYEHLEQLSTATEASLLSLHGFGPNALARLRAAIQELGLSFATTDAETKASIPENFGDLWSDDA